MFDTVQDPIEMSSTALENKDRRRGINPGPLDGSIRMRKWTMMEEEYKLQSEKTEKAERKVNFVSEEALFPTRWSQRSFVCEWLQCFTPSRAFVRDCSNAGSFLNWKSVQFLRFVCS